MELLTTPVIARHILGFTSRPFGGRQQFSPEDVPFTSKDILLRLLLALTDINPAQFLNEHGAALLVLDRTLASLVEEDS